MIKSINIKNSFIIFIFLMIKSIRGIQKNRITEKTEKTDGKLTEKTEPK
jgi:hypothetical protein